MRRVVLWISLGHDRLEAWDAGSAAVDTERGPHFDPAPLQLPLRGHAGLSG